MWSIIVHGGAGAIRDDAAVRHQEGCRRAVLAGVELLRAGGGSLDAACAAVRVLEDDPTYNSSHGGALDERGLVSVDAAVMRGSDLAYGAIGAVVGVARAIDLARAVLEDGRHSLLVGRDALSFARRAGVPIVDPRSLETEHARAEWVRRTAELAEDPRRVAVDWTPLAPPGSEPEAPAGGTVGAVAIDDHGVITAATSTGGLTAKYAGRVGDSPIAGAGTYARDDLGGVSATGHGETMMKTVLAYQALIALSGADPSRAPELLRAELDRAAARVGGRGGLIAVLPGGRVAHARNTRHMGVAWIEHGGGLGSDF